MMKKMKTKEIFRRFFLGFCATFFLFVCEGVGDGGAQAKNLLTDPEARYELGEWEFTLQRRWLDKETARTEIAACKANMQKYKLDELIKQVWGDLWDWGWGIACHESTGNPHLLENNIPQPRLGRGTCAFQITPSAKDGSQDLRHRTNRLNQVLGLNLKPEEFLERIWKDPVACVHSGHILVRDFLKTYRGKLPPSLCNFAGGAHVRQALRYGHCSIYLEFGYCKDMILHAYGLGPEPELGKMSADTKDVYDPHATGDNKKGYSNYTVNIQGIGRVLVLNCHDFDMSLPGKLAEATKAFRNAMLLSVQDQFEKTIEAQAKKTMKDSGPRGKFASKYCIDLERTINAFLDQLRKFLTLSGLKEFILDMIKDIVLRILEKVCQYILEGIDAVLEMICLPIPSFSLAFGLPQIERKNCNGISMNDIISLKTTGATSIEDIMGRSTSGGLLPVNPAMTKVPTPPALIYDLISKVPISASIN